MLKKFDKTNFTVHWGTDDLLYATSNLSGELFVFNGFDWMTFDEFINPDNSMIETVRDELEYF